MLRAPPPYPLPQGEGECCYAARRMIAPAVGVLFDGFAYGMLLFLLSVGLSVTLGMMNFVNLAHGSFAMLGAYVAVTLMALGWPFLATLPCAFLVAARGQRGVRTHAVPPAVSRERSRSRCC